MRTMSCRVIGPLLCLVLCALASASCGSVVRQGRGSSYLVIDNLAAASGAKADIFANVLQSDVVTNVKTQLSGQTIWVPTVFEDPGQIKIHAAMKDVSDGAGPTPNNEITINRYHVSFMRPDGRNSQGVDVPYAFDGAITATIGDQQATLSFVIVRAQAKKEAPLAALQAGGGSLTISTIAEITFYGRDQAGNQVSVTGKISVNFADWGDPQ